MIQKIATKSDISAILEEADKLLYWVDGSGAYMSISQSVRIPDNILQCKAMMSAIKEIGFIRGQEPLFMMLNKIPPGIIVPKHTDTLRGTLHQAKAPHLERWHLPLATNERAGWWDEMNGDFYMPLGFWYGPMHYWKLHQVWNKGKTTRIHLIVDLDTKERVA